MIQKIYYVTIDGKQILCSQLYSKVSYMLASLRSTVGLRKYQENRRYYNAAEDLMELLLELEEASKETNRHLVVIRRRYGWDESSTPDVDSIADKLFSEMSHIMPPIARMYLDKAVKGTEESRERVLREIKEEEDRMSCAENIKPMFVEQCSLISDVVGKQKAKADSKEYPQNNMRRENDIAKFLCSLYLESVFSEFISVGLLKTSVELEVVTESDISGILDKNGDERDYEWYMEDQISNDLSDKTIVRISDVLKLAADVIENILGYKIAPVA